MDDRRVSIGQIKRDISELVNRVAYAGERIVLTSRGRPKAALVSINDYEHLKQQQVDARMVWWNTWVAQSNTLTEQILEARKGRPIDLSIVWDEILADREARDEQLLGH